MSAPDRDHIELPAPTAWPMVAALGIAFNFAGLVMHPLFTMVGVVLVIAGAVGWFREVLPVEHVERVPLVPLAQRAQAVQPVTRAVAQLVPGVEGHRLRIPVEFHPYSSGILGGLVGGAAMAVVACAYGVSSTGACGIRSICSRRWRSRRWPPPTRRSSRRSTGSRSVVAAISHVAISIFVGLVYAAILPMFPRRPAVLGGVIAPLLWSGLLWASLGVINPALNARIDWQWFVASQIAFGLAAGAVITRTQRIRTMQSLPFAARAGIEAPGLARRRTASE